MFEQSYFCYEELQTTSTIRMGSMGRAHSHVATEYSLSSIIGEEIF